MASLNQLAPTPSPATCCSFAARMQAMASCPSVAPPLWSLPFSVVVSSSEPRSKCTRNHKVCAAFGSLARHLQRWQIPCGTTQQDRYLYVSSVLKKFQYVRNTHASTLYHHEKNKRTKAQKGKRTRTNILGAPHSHTTNLWNASQHLCMLAEIHHRGWPTQYPGTCAPVTACSHT